MLPNFRPYTRAFMLASLLIKSGWEPENREQRCGPQGCLQAAEAIRTFQAEDLMKNRSKSAWSIFFPSVSKNDVFSRMYHWYLWAQMPTDRKNSIEKSPEMQAEDRGPQPLISPSPPSLVPVRFIPKGGRKTAWKARREVSKDSKEFRLCDPRGTQNNKWLIPLINCTFY